eukprot:30509-Amphidinium_carterae.1
MDPYDRSPKLYHRHRPKMVLELWVGGGGTIWSLYELERVQTAPLVTPLVAASTPGVGGDSDFSMDMICVLFPTPL